MTASCVYLAADAYMVCLTHALSTEREEIMGLCIGEVGNSYQLYYLSVKTVLCFDQYCGRHCIINNVVLSNLRDKRTSGLNVQVFILLVSVGLIKGCSH